MIVKLKRERIIFCCVTVLLLAGCAGTGERDLQNVKDEVTTEALRQEQTTIEEDVDYDLTRMGSDMVYATVYQMLVDPASYEGKTVRISGTYYGAWYEPTSQYYFYVMIADAMACCSQGMEFIWGDGSHVYPDEYPTDGSEVEVTGTFETYREEGNDALYCRLKDASMIVK